MRTIDIPWDDGQEELGGEELWEDREFPESPEKSSVLFQTKLTFVEKAEFFVFFKLNSFLISPSTP